MKQPIIDFHTHVDEAEAFGWIDPPEKLIPLLDEAGIAQAVCMTYVDHPARGVDSLTYLAEACRRFPDRLIPFLRLDPNAGEQVLVDLRHAVRALEFRGVKLHPTTTLAVPAGDSTARVLEVAAELDIPALFHCGDDPYTTPQALELAAARVPEAAVVFAHMGGYLHVDDAIAAAERRPNVYLETSAMPYPTKIAEAVERIGSGRVLFGSDGPGCNPSLEVEKVRLAGLSEEDLTAVLFGTAARLLGLEATT